MSSAITQHWSTALSEEIHGRCILVMTEGLASTHGQVPSFRHQPQGCQSLRLPSTTGTWGSTVWGRVTEVHNMQLFAPGS